MILQVNSITLNKVLTLNFKTTENTWWLTGRRYLCLLELLEIFPFHRNYPSNYTDTCRTQPYTLKLFWYFSSSVWCQKVENESFYFTTPEEEQKHYHRAAFQQHLLALGQAGLIRVTRSSVHASACKRHGHLGLNGCRCERQVWHHHNIITSQIQHNTHNVTWH